MTRQSNIFARKKTIITRTSNRKDFDYLRLRKADNIRLYRPVQAILEEKGESNQLAVFSEIVQMYDTKLNQTEMIIMITNKSIFLLDCRCNIKRHIEIKNLSQIILVKANPSFFTLSFLYGEAPLILESFRRAELMVFTLALRENSNPKPSVIATDALNLSLKSGKTIMLDFSKG